MIHLVWTHITFIYLFNHYKIYLFY